MGVTRLILLAPCSFNSKKISDKRFIVISFPFKPPDISWFWQYAHPSEHPEKNTAPDPFSPEMQGSSHICNAALAADIDNVSLHAPVCPFMRFTPHFLGHRWQLSSNFLSFIIPDLSITDTIHIFHYLDVFFNHIFIYITDSIYRLL